MKTKIFTRLKRATASALLTALVICSIFSLFVVYYLSLIEQQNLLNARSQTWNMAIAITEAGIEEGLEHLNDNTGNLSLAPWSYIGGNTYYRSNALPDGSAYTVFITNTSPNPAIVSRAYVKVESFLSMTKSLSAGFFAAGGINTAPTPKVVTRAVLVNCNRNSLFLVPLVAKKNINLNGNNISTDSYSSCDPSKSINGQYAPNFYVGDHGDIASNLGVIDSINGGNANIYGKAHTGTNYNGQPTITVGPNGGVGSHDWQAINKGIEDGWALEDANFTFPDTTFPNTGGFLTSTGGVLVVSSNVVSATSTSSISYPSVPPPSGVTTNTTSTTTSTFPLVGTYIGSVTANKSHGVIVSYTYNLITGYTYNLYSTNLVWFTNSYDHILWGTTDLGLTNSYVENSLSGKTIVVGNNVTLALPNGLNMSGGDEISIIPFANILGNPATGPNVAAVVIYSGGTACAITGNAVINQPGYPIDFVVYCAPTVTSLALNGNGGFNGVLVAPSVDLTLNGSGSTDFDFIGAAMVNSATLNGHFHFHYDECLSNYKNNPRFLITAWNEIP
jgi:hypothetical protein